MAGTNPERALLGALHRTLPNATLVVPVNTTATVDLSAVVATEGDTTATDLRGRWVLIEAEGADIRAMRKDGGAITWPRGRLFAAGEKAEDFFVDPDASTHKQLRLVSQSAGNLLIHYDTEQK